jgi:hypothetical protein
VPMEPWRGGSKCALDHSAPIGMRVMPPTKRTVDFAGLDTGVA